MTPSVSKKFQFKKTKKNTETILSLSQNIALPSRRPNPNKVSVQSFRPFVQFFGGPGSYKIELTERNALSVSDKYDHLWICDWCKKRYVVPQLARDCEDKHLKENSV